MPYRLAPGAPIGEEVQRVARAELRRAVKQLRSASADWNDDAIHEARRHVKKARAALRLIRPALRSHYRGVNRRLRLVNRMLGPVADGESIVETFSRLGAENSGMLPPRSVSIVLARLVRREAQIDQQARIERVVQTATNLLRRERRRVEAWSIRAKGFRAVAGALDDSHRHGRRSRDAALADPSIETYHEWRHAVKEKWYQVRLLEERCAGRLHRDVRRLERLDGCLGEYHNLDILEGILHSDSTIGRLDAAQCLRVLRLERRCLRREARRLGRQIFDERPERFVGRVRRWWRAAKHDERRPARKAAA